MFCFDSFDFPEFIMINYIGGDQTDYIRCGYIEAHTRDLAYFLLVICVFLHSCCHCLLERND